MEMALDCAKYSKLPKAGGLEDQDAGYIEKLRILENVYRAFSSYSNTKTDQKTWTETYPGYWTIVAKVQRLRVNHGRA